MIPRMARWLARRLALGRLLLAAVAFFAGLTAATGPVFAQSAAPALLAISGQVVKPMAFTKDQLRALKTRKFSESRSVAQGAGDKDVVLSIDYHGVLLRDLLDLAGLKPDRREQRRAVILLTAQDGYQASFSWGELYNAQLGDSVVVVLHHGNSDLLDTDGLPALRSLQDLRGGPRHVRWLTKVEVLLP
jgi:hypothetical protein